jgi:hypothetical protein
MTTLPEPPHRPDVTQPPRPDLMRPPPSPGRAPSAPPKRSHAARNATIVVVVLVGLIIWAGIQKNAEPPGTSDTPVENGGIDPGLGTQDASGDVSVGACETDFGLITCGVTIVNSSDGRSDYYIEATIEDPSGAKVGTANTLVTGVEGGQTAKDELTGTFSGAGKDLSVRLTEVQRTAS